MSLFDYLLNGNFLPLLTYTVEHWVTIILVSLCLSIIGVLAFLLITQLPKILKSIMNFVDAATTNIPIITQSINSLILNVEKMNSTLTALLSIQNRVDNMETKVLAKLDEVLEKTNSNNSILGVIAAKV